MQNVITLTEKLASFAKEVKKQDIIIPTEMNDKNYTFSVKSADDWRAELKREEDENRLLRIGIIGRVKAGKSSLLNALLFNGESVLPQAATPMTAALTSIKYGKTFQAKVIFYTQKDIEDIKRKALAYEEEFKAELTKQTNLLIEKQQGSRKALSESELKERAKRNTSRELKESFNLACYDQYQRMQASRLTINDEEMLISANSSDELLNKMSDYVGADGKYMPYTREVELYLPEERLKGLEIVDTPGVNDPISSREERTTQFLKACDAVFMISPSSDFLHEQDVSFLGRITKGSGILRASIVASKADDDLFGSLSTESTNPARVFDKLAEQLTEQAHKVLDKQGNKTIAEDVIELFKKDNIICSSSMAYNLLKKFDNKASWSEGMQKVWENFNNVYPTAFKDDESSKSILREIANIEKVENVLEKTKNDKTEIFEKNKQAKVPVAKENLEKCLDYTIQRLVKKKQQIENESTESIQKKRADIQNQAEQIEKAVKAGLNEHIIELKEDTNTALSTELAKCLEGFNQRAEKAKGQTSESYTYTEDVKVEKDGFFSWAARKTGLGGYTWETRTRTGTRYVDVVNANNILEDIIKIRENIVNAIINSSREMQKEYKKQFYDDIRQSLRIAFDRDRRPDDALVSSAISDVLNEIKLPEFKLSDIPPEVNKTGQLKKKEGDQYMADAKQYVGDLYNNTNREITTFVKDIFDQIKKYPTHTRLVEVLDKESKKLEEEVANKATVLVKYNELINQAYELAKQVKE